MFRSALIGAALALPAAAPASAEIVSRSENAFTLRFAVGLEASREDVVAAVGDIPQWWDGDHTYTGNAANLTFSLEEGGCWCERMGDGSIFEHAVVTAVEPTRVALNAPLGPLNDKATRADLTFSAGPENRGVLAAMDFVVEGPGVGAFADAVHGVMQRGWTRYIRFIEYGEPEAGVPDGTAD
jgi:uncharacterized protein YndB with AHSA1/START domain